MKSALISVLAWVLLVCILVSGWMYLQDRERAVLESRLQETSRQVARRTEDFFAGRLEQLEDLAARLAEDGRPSEARFRNLSRRYQERFPGFQALNWVDENGRITWTEPEAENEAARGFDLTVHPFAAEAFAAARAGESVAMTPPIELLQGGWGFATYARVHDGARSVGYLNGVFRIRDVLQHCLDRTHDAQFTYVLHDGEQLLEALGSAADPATESPEARTALRIAGRDLTLSVMAHTSWVAAEATWTDEALLLGAILLAGALAAMAHLAVERQHKAERAAVALEVLVENAPDAIVTIDPDTGAFVAANERARKLFGLSAPRPGAAWDSGPAAQSLPLQPDGRQSVATFAELVDAASHGVDTSFEWTFRTHAGRTFPAEVHLVRLPGPRRDVVRASIMDITSRRDLEQALRQSQALEAMGRLAGGVAHDFNNLVTACLGASELLLERVHGDTESESLARVSIQACERAGELTRQLLAFSRHSPLQPTSVDLSALVAGLRGILERLVGERVRLETSCAPRLPTVHADASQLELVIVNLVINARDAMPQGGRILITTEACDDHVLLSVRDEGTGIADGDIEHVFEPFFTTKEPGVGTGIGLATVQRIVDQAGGRVDVESRVGHGATFRVSLPGEGVPGTPAPTDPAPATRRGDGLILLVEDDEAVRRIMCAGLEAAGYRILTASRGAEALDVASRPAGPIDLLITDYILPDTDGLEIATRLRATRPELSTLLISGYSHTDIDTSRLALGRIEFLAKPFTLTELTQRIGTMARTMA